MKITSHWPGVTKHLIAFALGWCLLSVLLGLFYAFDAMEASEEAIISQAIPQFLQVTAITFLIGSTVLSLLISFGNYLPGKNALGAKDTRD